MAPPPTAQVIAPPAATNPFAEPPAEKKPEGPSSLLGDISLDQPLREARDEFERVYFEYHLVRENYRSEEHTSELQSRT